jgi:hypothetical protein
MAEAQHERVQDEARRLLPGALAVASIACDGMTDGRCVHANLVGPSRFQARFREGRFPLVLVLFLRL